MNIFSWIKNIKSYRTETNELKEEIKLLIVELSIFIDMLVDKQMYREGISEEVVDMYIASFVKCNNKSQFEELKRELLNKIEVQKYIISNRKM